MGASNTVVKTPEGKLIGYNTDGVGFYTSLVEEDYFLPHPFFPGNSGDIRLCSQRGYGS